MRFCTKSPRNVGPYVVLSVLLLGLVSLLGNPPAAHAASGATLVQESGNVSSPNCIPGKPPCTVVVSFPSNVAPGDVVVVGIVDSIGGLGIPALSVSDSLGTSYSLATSVTDSGDVNSILIYDSRLSSGGADTVTVTDSSGNSLGLVAFIFEISGVTTASARTATGSSTYPNSFTGSISTSSRVAFSSGAFLLGIVTADDTGGSAGTGFTYYTPVNAHFFTEYATSGVSSPTNFPASLTSALYIWDEAGIALAPLASTTTTTSCSPSPVADGLSTTCTAIVAGDSPTGTVAFTSSSSTGVFTPSNGQCTLSSGSCSVSYVDTSSSTPTITGTYSGDTTNAASSGTFLLSVAAPPQDPCEYGGLCFTSFIAFNATSGGKVVDANVTIFETYGPTQIGTTEVGSPLQAAWYAVSTRDTVSYSVTLPDGHTATGTASNSDAWTVLVVNVSG